MRWWNTEHSCMSILIEYGMLTIAKGVHLGNATEATVTSYFFCFKTAPCPSLLAMSLEHRSAAAHSEHALLRAACS